nr:hypothetical protein [Tanacetum cinerariifolium]
MLGLKLCKLERPPFGGDSPRVTSSAADEGSMQLKLDELTALCTSLQRQHLEMVAKFEAQELEIHRLKDRVKQGKEKMIESKTPKKKNIQELVDIQMARQLEEEMEREDQRMNEQIA